MLQDAWHLARRYEPLLIVSSHLTSVFLNWHIVMAVLPRFALEFGVTLAAAGLLISAFTLARLCLNFPSGLLVDRIGRRPMLLAGGLVTGLGSIGSGLAQGFPELVVMRFLTGAGGAVAITAEVTMMADISTRGSRARMMGFSEGMIALGVSFGPAVGGLVADAAGLRLPFYVAGCLTLLVTLWAAFRLPETRGWNVEAGLQAGRAGGPEVGLWGGLKTILSDRNYLMIMVVGFASFFTRFGTLFLLLPLLAYSERVGMTVGEFGVMASAVAGVQALLLPVGGILADRLGRKTLIVPSTVLTGLALVAYGLAPTREWFLAAAAFYALAAGINGPAPGAYLADVAPSRLRGLSMGTYRTCGDLAGLVAPVILGAAASYAAQQGTAVVINGLLVVAAGIAFAVLAAETAPSRTAEITPARPVIGPGPTGRPRP